MSKKQANYNDITYTEWLAAMKQTDSRIAVEVIDGLTVEHFALIDGEMKRALNGEIKECGSEAKEIFRGAVNGWSLELTLEPVLIEDTPFVAEQCQN